MKDKTQTITFYGVCIFLFCYFLRIFNMPNELTLIAGAILCLVLLIQQKKFRIDLGVCLLTITLGSYYVIINGTSGLLYSILYIPLVIYEIGNYMACAIEKKKNQDKKLQLLVMLLVIGFSIHGILNSYMWYAGYAVPGTRRWPDFWNGNIVPGTQHVAYFMPAMALFVPAVFYFKSNKALNVIMIVLTAFFGYTALATRSRMTVLIFAIVIFLQFLLYVVYEWNMVKQLMKNKWLWIACVGIIAGMVTCFFWVKDMPVMAAFINNLGKDGGILNNERFQSQRLALQQIFDYPVGGYQMNLGGLGQCHNVWLDMANAAGLIPFFAFVAYTMYSIYNLVRFMRKSDTSTEIKLLVMGVYSSFLLYFTVEPALEASIHWITPWLFLNGIIYGNQRNKG